MKPHHIVPDASMPSLRTLLADMPEGQDLYTNDDLFAPSTPVAAPADDAQRTTMNPVAGERPSEPRNRVAGAFVATLAAAGALWTLDASTARHAGITASAAHGVVAEMGFVAWAALRDDAIVERAQLSTPQQRSERAIATREAAPATAESNAPTVSAEVVAVTPIEDASVQTGARDQLIAALASDEPKRLQAFDAGAAAASVQAALARAAACGDGSAHGDARISVTFARSGRATAATIDGSALAGTSVGSCIARAMQSTSVPAYEGDTVTVRRWISIR